MPKAGQVFDNPVTGERMIFVKTGPDTNGTLLEIEFFIKPGGGKGLPRNILQTIVMLQALEPSAYVAGIPVFIQHPLFWLAAAIGRAFGYKAYYPAVSTTTVPY